MEFRLLGPMRVDRQGEPVLLLRRRQRCLLALLLMEAGRTVPAHRLIDLLWDAKPPARAAAILGTYVSRLRAALPEISLVREGDGYAVHIDPESVDVHRFTALVERARTVTGTQRVTLLRQADQLWQGTPLADAASDRLRERVCTGLDKLRRSALELRLEAELDLGRHDELLTELAELTQREPLDETLVRFLMLALYRVGRRAEALQAFARLRDRLAEELGLDPSTQLSRLQGEILRADPSLHHPLWTARFAPAQLPPDLTGFAGRRAEMARMDDHLTGTGTSTGLKICVVTGGAGVGKTTLALHWAHRRRPGFPDGQLYVNLRGFDPGGSTMDPSGALRSLLDALGIPSEHLPSDLADLAALYRSVLADRRILIVLDNAHDAEQVRPLLPGGPGCVAVVTSRHQLTGLITTVGALPVNLDALRPDEATDLMAMRLGPVRVASHRAAVDRILASCGYLPLALAIVAAQATVRPDFPLEALADELDASATVLDALATADPSTDLRSTFFWSYRGLSPAAQRLFRLLGLHAGPDIGTAAAASLTGVTALQTRRSLVELCQAHLLTESAPGRFTRHDLLRAYAGELAHAPDLQAERDVALHRLLDHYLHNAHRAACMLDPNRRPIALEDAQSGVVREEFTGHDAAMDWFETERAVLVDTVSLAARSKLDAHAWKLAWALATYLRRKGFWREWLRTQEIALESAIRSQDLAGQANAHYLLALVRQRHGDPAEAEHSLREALRCYRVLDDLYGQASVHFVICLRHEETGDYARALASATQVLELYRLAGHAAGQARALGTVGWYQGKLGNFEAGLEHSRAALALLRESGDLVGEANIWDSLGFMHDGLGRHAGAIECYERSILLYQKLDYRYRMAEPLERLGDTRLVLGDPQAAGDSWRQALDVLVELDHPDSIRVRAKLAALPKS